MTVSPNLGAIKSVHAPTCDVKSVSKSFDGRPALSNVSFSLAAGEIVALVGENGAGKTTLLRSMLHLCSYDGEILYGGRRYDQLSSPAWQVGVALGPFEGHPRVTVGRHLKAAARLNDIDTDRVQLVLAKVGLDGASTFPLGKLSLGMRQRMAMARSFLGAPRILLLDEPSNGLDPRWRRWLREEIRLFADAGGSVLYSSHDIGEVEIVADRVVLLEHGRVRMDRSIADLLRPQKCNICVVAASRLAELADRLAQAGASVSELGEQRLEVQGLTSQQIGQLAMSGRHVISELTTLNVSLEDAVGPVHLGESAECRI